MALVVTSQKEIDRPPSTDSKYCGWYYRDLSKAEEFIPPLVRTVILGNTDLVRVLLTNGADVNIFIMTLDVISTPMED
jgi:hypothetical protein